MQDITDLITSLNTHRPAITVAAGSDISARLAAYLDGWQVDAPFTRPCLCNFVEPEAHQDLINRIHTGDHPVAHAARAIPMDLRLYEMAAPHHKNDDTQLQAIAYGMMAVDETMDVAVLCGMDAGVEATCLNSFMTQAPAPQAGLLGAMIAALQADMPCLYAGDMAGKTATLLARLAPQAATRLIPASSLGLGQEQDPAMAALMGYTLLRLAGSTTGQQTNTQAA